MGSEKCLFIQAELPSPFQRSEVEISEHMLIMLLIWSRDYGDSHVIFFTHSDFEHPLDTHVMLSQNIIELGRVRERRERSKNTSCGYIFVRTLVFSFASISSFFFFV